MISSHLSPRAAGQCQRPEHQAAPPDISEKNLLPQPGAHSGTGGTIMENLRFQCQLSTLESLPVLFLQALLEIKSKKMTS